MDTKLIEDVYTLSPMQEGFLYHSLYAPTSGIYVAQMSYTLHGNLNVAGFKQALQQVIDRHPILRTAFVWEGLNQPLQIVYQQLKLPFEQQDWRHLSSSEHQQLLFDCLQADRIRGFDLSIAPLMRFGLIQLSKDSYQLIWTHHHLILDGWSTPILMKEVFTFYEACCRGQAPHLERSRPYRDYIAWVKKQPREKTEAFWRQALKGFTAPTLPCISRAAGDLSGQEATSDEQSIKLSATTTGVLKSVAHEHQLTLNTLVQGIWGLLLSHYSGKTDVVFGATSSGRPVTLEGSDKMVGLFINTLPVRVTVDWDMLFLSWLKNLQVQQAKAREYEYTSLADIQGWSDMPRDLPLFESAIVFENYPTESLAEGQDRNLQIGTVPGSILNNFSLTIRVVPSTKLLVEILSNRRCFNETSVKRMLSHITTLLCKIAANPRAQCSDLLLLTEAERHQLLREWNNTGSTFDTNQCLHKHFEAQVTLTPDAIAVVFEEKQLTYRRLDQRANQLAHHLQKLGVGPEVRVGLCMERSLEMIIGLLGILKAGGAYVPLDPTAPKPQIAFMLSNAQVSLALTQTKLVQNLSTHGIEIVDLESGWETITRQPETVPTSETTVDNLVYLIYTSGSTGKTKGVAVEHKQLLNYVNGIVNRLNLTPGSTFATVSTLSADLGNTLLFTSLCRGDCLHVISYERAANSNALSDYFCRHHIDGLKIVPSHLAALQTAAVPAQILPHRWLILGGEASSWKSVEALQNLAPVCNITNHYGPTEATIGVSTYSVANTSGTQKEGSLPIGRPLPNTQIYVLNQRWKPVPIGVEGELYIAGKSLTRGYLNRSKLTAEMFVPDPFGQIPGARMYKTGDVVSYLHDGNIQFIGRADHQVKIRGYRVEMAAIEATLLQHPTVHQSVVTSREEHSGDKYLIAYVVAVPGTEPTVEKLRHFLEERLSHYMVPKIFVMLSALPLTSNGKVDRRALPVPDQSRAIGDEEAIAPRDMLEFRLRQIWEDLLDIFPIGIWDNFFELGGHSLIAVRLMAQIQKTFSQEIPLATLLEAQTIEEMANILRQQSEPIPQSLLVNMHPRGTKPPYFLIPSTGEVIEYADLVRYFREIDPDQPLYGLRTPGMYEEQDLYTEIQPMAAHFIEEIRTVQPEGPYFVGGSSMGGLVAFEVAQQLEAQQQKVGLLVLVDTVAFLPDEDHATLLFEKTKDFVPLSKDHLKQLNTDEQITHFLEQAKLTNWLPGDVEFSKAQHLLNLFMTNVQAGRRYTPKPYPGRITLFRATEVDSEKVSPEVYAMLQEPTLGWSKVAGGVEIHMVPGSNHRNITREPYVRSLVEQLKGCLDKARMSEGD